MPQNESTLTLQIPPGCPECAATDRVKLEPLVLGKVVMLLWRCAECNSYWPIQPRQAPPDSASA
jgi:transposase-like protein